MKYEELPEIPEPWCQFLRGRMPFLPASGSIPSLIASATVMRNQGMRRDVLCRQLVDDGALCFDQTLENLRKLRQPESVAVVTNFYPALFGGPAFQLHKCLTALKICEELACQSVQAVPVCWIGEEMPALPQWSARIMSAESEICSLESEPQETDRELLCEKIAPLLAHIEELGHGEYDPESLEILRLSFAPGNTLARACARLVAALMQEWGILVLDPRTLDLREAGVVSPLALDISSTFVAQCAVLPVIANVIDPFEVDSFAGAQSLFKKHFPAVPMAWPQASATVIDSRSRRILNRHSLDVNSLFSGAEAIISEVIPAIPGNVSEKLARLKMETETSIERLCALDPAGAFAKAVSSGKEKIGYQLDRLKQKYEAACKTKEETIRRQIRRVCNSLAPNGRIQEREIAGIQLPLRYSRMGLRALYGRLDILSLEHQLISMD